MIEISPLIYIFNKILRMHSLILEPFSICTLKFFTFINSCTEDRGFHPRLTPHSMLDICLLL